MTAVTRVVMFTRDVLRVIFDGAYQARRAEREIRELQRERALDPYLAQGEREVEELLNAYAPAFMLPSFTCPQCGKTSHNPNDVLDRYCGSCHRRVGQPIEELRPP